MPNNMQRDCAYVDFGHEKLYRVSFQSVEGLNYFSNIFIFRKDIHLRFSRNISFAVSGFVFSTPFSFNLLLPRAYLPTMTTSV